MVMPHMLPQALVFALTEIFEELCQLDESRCASASPRSLMLSPVTE